MIGRISAISGGIGLGRDSPSENIERISATGGAGRRSYGSGGAITASFGSDGIGEASRAIFTDLFLASGDRVGLRVLAILEALPLMRVVMWAKILVELQGRCTRAPTLPTKRASTTNVSLPVKK